MHWIKRQINTINNKFSRNEKKTHLSSILCRIPESIRLLKPYFITDCLKYFNLGPDLIKWIKVLYYDIFSNTINNGYMSDQFQIQKGVGQRCPLSSSLFLQVLTNYIKLKKYGTETSVKNLITSIHTCMF